MKKNLNWVRTLVAICVLAMLVGMLPASAFAEETIEIPEEDYLYVNGESKVLTAGEEMALLCLVVEDPGKVHVLASGVDITMVLFDDTAGEVRGVYTSEHGLMDVPFFAAPGMFILGITGNGEVEILAADDAKTASIYEATEPSEEAAQPAEVSSEVPAEAPASDPAADSAEAPAEEAAEAPAEEAVEAPAEEAVEAPAEEAVDEQALFEAAYAAQIALYREFGEWADLSSVPYDVQLRIKELVDGEKAEPAEEAAEAPAEEAVEAPAEEAVEAPAEEAAEAPAEEAAEAPAEEAVEAPAEEVVEEPDEQALFEARYANEIALYRQFGQWADLGSVPYEDQIRIKELVDGPAADPAEEVAEEPVEAPAPVTEVTIAVERGESDAVRLFAEEDLGEEYLYQWQYSLDGIEWLDIAGANNSDYTFTLDNTNGRYYWRLIVSVK